MRGRDSNRISMIGTTIDFCEKNVSATAGISAFAGVLAKVKDKRQQIHELGTKDRSNLSKGVTDDLTALRERMSQQALKCGSAATAYAYSINDFDLAAKTNFTEKRLRQMGKQNVASTCQNIHDAVLAHIAEVVNWGITNTDVSELNGLIAEYRQKSPDPRQALITRGDANRRIKAIVREVIDSLFGNQMDHMVNTLKVTNHFFWRGYRMSRNIIDLGVVHAKLKGIVVDANGVPLVNVWLRVYEKDTKKLLKETVSAGGGVFSINPMPVGNFDLEWEHEGYITKVESNARVGAGKIVKRKVTLMRIKN